MKFHITVLALAGCAAQALAQTPATLADAVEAAWQRTAASAEAAGQLRQAQAERDASFAPWAAAPSLELGAARNRQRASGASREAEIGLSLPLWLPGQRGARLTQVQAQSELAQAWTVAARLRVAGEVREAWAELGMLAAEVSAAQEPFNAFEALARDVGRRVAAGDLARADLLAAEAERLAAGAALAQARQRQRAAELHWQALTGLPPPLSAQAPAPAPPHPAQAPVPALPHPALRLAAVKVEAARQRVSMARLSRRDAPELLLRARQEVATGEPTTQGWGVALRIPWATVERNAPLEAAALAELAGAEAAESQLRRQLDAELAAARLALAAAQQQFSDEQTRAGLLRERARLIQQSFEAGETALPDMLRALTAATQAQAAVARAQAALAQTTGRLDQAQGVLP